MATLHAGTSGFAYPAWKPDFYPADLPAARFLQHYAGRLNAVEVNYTFRRAPSASTLEGWIRETPDGFTFAAKAHQRITHFARLNDAAEPTAFFFSSVEPLRAAGRLGPVLFQLPPNLKADVDRLASYLPLLPTGVRATFEFRDPSWFSEETYEVLRRHNAALCLAESEKLETPEVFTADFVYIRLRKPDYSADDLASVERRVRAMLATGRDVFAFFKHEETAAGALEAEQLLRAA